MTECWWWKNSIIPKIIFFPSSYFFLSSLCSGSFLGLDHHNGVDLSVWQDSCYLISYWQGLFLQVIDDIITFFLRGQIATVCLPVDVNLSIPVIFFWRMKVAYYSNLFYCARKTFGVLLGLNSGPCFKQFYEANAFPLN